MVEVKCTRLSTEQKFQNFFQMVWKFFIPKVPTKLLWRLFLCQLNNFVWGVSKLIWLNSVLQKNSVFDTWENLFYSNLSTINSVYLNPSVWRYIFNSIIFLLERTHTWYPIAGTLKAFLYCWHSWNEPFAQWLIMHHISYCNQALLLEILFGHVAK